MLTKIQKQERDKRKRNRLNMMGLRQPPGTPPDEHRMPEKPWWTPRPKESPGLFSMGGIIEALNLRLNPFLHRQRYKGIPPGERPPEAR